MGTTDGSGQVVKHGDEEAKRREVVRALGGLEWAAATRWDGGPGPWFAVMVHAANALAALGGPRDAQPADLETTSACRSVGQHALAELDELARLRPTVPAYQAARHDLERALALLLQLQL